MGVKVFIDRKETERARQKFGDDIVVGRFGSSIPLYRVIDGEELRKVLKGGGFTGGEFAVPGERAYGAQWGSSLSQVVKWGNSQRGGRLGYELFVAEIDGNGHRFSHLSGAGGKLNTGEDTISLEKGFCNTGLGCSIKVPARMVKNWYVVEGNRANRINLKEVEMLAGKSGRRPRKVEFYLGASIKPTGSTYSTLKYVALKPEPFTIVDGKKVWSLEERDMREGATLSSDRLGKRVLDEICRKEDCMGGWLISREKAKTIARGSGPDDATRGFAVVVGITVETAIPDLEADFGDGAVGKLDFVAVWMPTKKRWNTIWQPNKKIRLRPSGMKLGRDIRGFDTGAFSRKWEDEGLDVFIFKKRGGDVELAQVIVPKESRGMGIGTEFMKDLVRRADASGATVVLTPDTTYGGSSVRRLKGFYKRFGFVENKGRKKDYSISATMYRRPKGKTASRVAGLLLPPPVMEKEMFEWVREQVCNHLRDYFQWVGGLGELAKRYSSGGFGSSRNKAGKDFDVDLSGWKYLRDFEGKTAKDVEAIVGHDHINLSVDFNKDRPFGKTEGRKATVYGILIHPRAAMPEWDTGKVKAQFDRYMNEIEDAIGHELTHVSQVFLQRLFSLEKRPGLPGKGDNNRDPKDLDYLQYALQDKEFYPWLRDEVSRFNREFDGSDSATVRKWIRESRWFRTLREHDLRKWKKAVREFTKATGRERVASDWNRDDEPVTFWGKEGAGLLLTTGEKVLLLKRSSQVDQPGTWGIPGGAMDDGESPMQAAKRETVEETGRVPSLRVVGKTVFSKGGFKYTTFICRVSKEYTPSLDWENSDWAWVSREELRSYRLHFGVRYTLGKADVFDKAKVAAGLSARRSGRWRGRLFRAVDSTRPGGFALGEGMYFSDVIEGGAAMYGKEIFEYEASSLNILGKHTREYERIRGKAEYQLKSGIGPLPFRNMGEAIAKMAESEGYDGIFGGSIFGLVVFPKSVRKVKKLGRAKVAATTPLPGSFPKGEPALMTKEEFLDFRNPKGKSHPDTAYDWSVEKMNVDHGVSTLGAAGDIWVLKYKGGIVLKQGSDGKIVGVLRNGTLYYSDRSMARDVPITYVSRGEWAELEIHKRKRVKYISEAMALVSNTVKRNLNEYPYLYKNVRAGGEQLQVRFRSSPQKDKGTSMAVINEKGQIVAQAQDEWGATLLAVGREYRGKGLGKLIGKIWYEWNPKYTSGGFTTSGMGNAIAIWQDAVREFLARGWYSELIREGRVKKQRVMEIISGVGERSLPREVKEKVKPKGVLVYAESPSFIVYDEAFLEEQDDRFIYGHGFFRSSGDKDFVYRIDYDRKFRDLTNAVAMQMSRDEGEKVWVGEGYADMMELDGVPGVVVEGDYAWLERNVVPLRSLATKERATRRKVDPYGEKLDLLFEMAESKW
jgi:8-oxo-dGTP pyrophosphatase MutT (NUDIX family)/GNAT superfamily N-acetyltransferase